MFWTVATVRPFLSPTAWMEACSWWFARWEWWTGEPVSVMRKWRKQTWFASCPEDVIKRDMNILDIFLASLQWIPRELPESPKQHALLECHCIHLPRRPIWWNRYFCSQVCRLGGSFWPGWTLESLPIRYHEDGHLAIPNTTGCRFSKRSTKLWLNWVLGWFRPKTSPPFGLCGCWGGKSVQPLEEQLSGMRNSFNYSNSKLHVTIPMFLFGYFFLSSDSGSWCHRLSTWRFVLMTSP